MAIERRPDQPSERLLGELPGIAARCLAAYHRARERGRLIQPRSAQALEAKLARSSDPYAQFMQETFITDPTGTVSCTRVFSEFKFWCKRNGREELLTSITTTNIRKLVINKVAGFEDVSKSFKPKAEPRRYAGMRLRSPEEREGEEE